MSANWWESSPVVGGAAAPSAAPASSAAGEQWWSSSPVVGGAQAPAAPPPQNPVEAAGAAAGASFGKTVLNLQGLAGKGLQSVGASGLGDWLVNDAEQGKTKLAREVAPYEASNPTATAVGRLGGELVATLPVGGALGAGARAAGAADLGAAIASGGLRAGQAGLATRVLGGAVNGGASAGLISPEQAASGAAIGAAVPLAARGLGLVGGAVGAAVRGRDVPPGVLQAAQDAQAAGFRLPPSQVNPTLLNQALEGLGGKIKTAQLASIGNQGEVNSLVRSQLGLQAGEQITPDALNAIRQRAGAAYDAVGNTGIITPTAAYGRALDNITAPYRRAAAGFPNATPHPVIAEIDSLRSGAFDARSAIDKIRELRGMADAAYRRGEKDLGRAYRGGAEAVENAIEQHLGANGFPLAMLDEFRNARQTIARTYSVESALNGTTGDVAARKLAAQLARGKPLSGNLETIARAAQAFPKAFQDPAVIGSVTHFSPLDVAATAMFGAAGAGVASLGVPLARTAARSAALSGPIQRSLAQAPQPSSLAALAFNPQATSLLGRAAPVALTSPSP